MFIKSCIPNTQHKIITYFFAVMRSQNEVYLKPQVQNQKSLIFRCCVNGHYCPTVIKDGIFFSLNQQQLLFSSKSIKKKFKLSTTFLKNIFDLKLEVPFQINSCIDV